MTQVVYSTRFLAVELNGTTTSASYTVPAGHRAVIRGVQAMNSGAASGHLTLPGVVVLSHVTGGTGFVGESFDLMAVANAGEAIGVVRDSGTSWWTVSGFLLTLP